MSSLTHGALMRRALSMGLAYAPPWLPDELLYSWLGRLARENALGSPRDCLEQLFGSRTFIPSADLPTRLMALHSRLGYWAPFQTAEQLLECGSLFPYHRPFLTSARCASISGSMLSGDGKGLKTLLGRVANRFGANPALRWCALCMVDSVARYGSLYWLRKHQLPGVNCCIDHGTRLESILDGDPGDRQRFRMLARGGSIPTPSEASPLQLRFSKLSEDLLLSGLPAVDPLHRASTYRAAALKIGISHRRGRLDYRDLANGLRHRFEDFHAFDQRDRLLATAHNPLGWLKDLFERPERSVHPICHLVLIDLLFGSVRAYGAAIDEAPTMSSPANDASQITPTTPKSRAQSAEAEAALQDAGLSCRQVALQLGISVNTVVMLRRIRGVPISERRKALTDEQVKAVRSELIAGASPSAISSSTGLSLSTVYRLRAPIFHALPAPPTEPSKAQVQERRRRWEQAIAVHGSKGVRATRTAAPADYQWLYRHDRAWLTFTTQSIHRPRNPAPRVDWSKRDAELSRRLLQHVATLRETKPPQRITASRLTRLLGEAMVRQNKARLPGLHDHLDQAVESKEQFGIRRIDYAISVLVEEGRHIKAWRIRRVAGLRVWSVELSNYLLQEVAKLEAQYALSTRATRGRGGEPSSGP